MHSPLSNAMPRRVARILCDFTECAFWPRFADKPMKRIQLRLGTPPAIVGR
jgi:hypothetical protein